MQQKVLDTIADAAHEVVHQPRNATTGTLFVQPVTGFSLHASIDYRFGDERADLSLLTDPAPADDQLLSQLTALSYSAPGEGAGASGTFRAQAQAAFTVCADYGDPAQLDAFLAALRTVLAH